MNMLISLTIGLGLVAATMAAPFYGVGLGVGHGVSLAAGGQLTGPVTDGQAAADPDNFATLALNGASPAKLVVENAISNPIPVVTAARNGQTLTFRVSGAPHKISVQGRSLGGPLPTVEVATNGEGEQLHKSVKLSLDRD